MDSALELIHILCTTVGAFVLLAIIIVPTFFFLHRHFTKVKCPECGHRKFYIMVGGPPKCKKCGWQKTQDWTDKNPNVKIRGRRWDADWD